MSHFAEPSGLLGMTTSERTVLLAGASGVFGKHITRALTDAGYEVLGLGRGPSNALRADLIDRDQVLRAVEGRRADVAVHAATALAKPPVRNKDMAGTDLLRTTGMRNFVEAAQLVGATRIVSESMMFGYGYRDFGPMPITEDREFGPHESDPALEAHVAAMRFKEQLTFGTPGIDGVALRFGLFYGQGAMDEMVTMLRRRMLPAPTSDGRVQPWVNLEDAAAAVVAAIERGRPGAAYNIADDAAIGFGDQIRAIATAFGTPKPFSAPHWLLRPMSYLTAVLHTNLRMSTARAAADLGWRPKYPTSAEGLAALAGSQHRSSATSRDAV